MKTKILILIVCMVTILALIIGIFISPNSANNTNSTEISNSTPESGAPTAVTNFTTFIKGITPLAVYNYASYEINWKLFKKDNSNEKDTYSTSDDNIQNWSNEIKKDYPLNNNQEKGEAVFNYTYYHIVTKWHVHDNTACSIQDVAKYHEANCAETSRIVYNLCLAVGIPKEDVRCVHSSLQHHYWVQIRYNGNWINVDASHAGDDTYHITAFGLSEPANDVQPISEDGIA